MSAAAPAELNLIWIDLEMTGLDTVNDTIIEIATLVTDAELNLLAEGPSIAIHQDEAVLIAWTSGTPVSTRSRDWCSGCGRAGTLRGMPRSPP